MTARTIGALVLLAFTLLVGVARAEPPDNCLNPRAATDSVFAWLQPDSYDAKRATMCLDTTGRGPDELQRSAKRIKAIYDARGALVDMAAISDDPNYKNANGRQRVVPHEALPDIYVEKQRDGRWRWPKSSLDRVAQLDRDAHLISDSAVDKLPDWLRTSFLKVELWQYISLLLIFALGIVVRRIIAAIVANRVRKLVETLNQAWAARMVDVFASPGATLVMAGLLAVAYPQLRLPVKAAVIIAIVVKVLTAISVVWALYRLVDVLAARMQHKAELTESKLDDQVVPLVRKTLKAVVVVAGALFILQNLDVDVGSLLAGVGIGGLAFALAAKDTLANLFGSVMIFLDRPFQIGDWVVVAGAEGIVEEVGFRTTRIRAFDNSLITMPNSKFTENKITNYGAREFKRCFVTFNLTYDTSPEQMQAFVEGVRAIIRANEYTRKDFYEVHMSAFGAHSVDVMAYFFFVVDTWTAELRERHNFFLEVMRLASDLKVSFAFPTQTLHLDHVAQPGAPRQLPNPGSEEELATVVHAFGPDGRRARPAGPKITDGYLAVAETAGSTDDGEGG